jgi:hypothetical protein
MPPVTQLVTVLMTAIGPAILVSAVGMLLLTLTNRFGRVIDRARALAAPASERCPGAARNAAAQLEVLWRRARMIRLSIALASTSALFAVLLITALFVTALFHLELAWLIASLFAACLAALAAALVMFLRDIDLSLAALALETAEITGPAESAASAESAEPKKGQPSGS